MLQTVSARKLDQTQRFLENGMRIPVTSVLVVPTVVTSHRTAEKNGYWAIQIGVGQKKNATKAELGHGKGAKLEKAPLFLQEIRLAEITTGEELPPIGERLNVEDILKAGDIVNVTGISKGKGFAGGVKRYHFRGGPRTHGQSDRERAPGSIGQTTTPGRVYRGKKMAGNMGNDQVTVKNLEVIAIEGDTIFIKGVVPGVKGKTFVTIKKVGEKKHFVPFYKEVADEGKQPQELSVEQAPEEKIEPVQTMSESQAEPVGDVQPEEKVAEN